MRRARPSCKCYKCLSCLGSGESTGQISSRNSRKTQRESKRFKKCLPVMHFHFVLMSVDLLQLQECTRLWTQVLWPQNPTKCRNQKQLGNPPGFCELGTPLPNDWPARMQKELSSPWSVQDPRSYRSKGSSPGKKCVKSFGPQPFGIDFQRVQPNGFSSEKPTTKLQFPGQTN